MTPQKRKRCLTVAELGLPQGKCAAMRVCQRGRHHGGQDQEDVTGSAVVPTFAPVVRQVSPGSHRAESS